MLYVHVENIWNVILLLPMLVYVEVLHLMFISTALNDQFKKKNYQFHFFLFLCNKIEIYILFQLDHQKSSSCLSFLSCKRSAPMILSWYMMGIPSTVPFWQQSVEIPNQGQLLPSPVM